MAMSEDFLNISSDKTIANTLKHGILPLNNIKIVIKQRKTRTF